MQSDISGVSTCRIGEEKHETFKAFNGKKYVQYERRHENGKLFTGVFKSVEIARQKYTEFSKKQG